MARNLSWIDKRKLNSLLEGEDEDEERAPRRPASLLDDDPPRADRFAPRARPARDRFADAPAPRRGPPAAFLGQTRAPQGLLDDEVPAPPPLRETRLAPFPEPNAWRPSAELPKDETGPTLHPGDERVLESAGPEDLAGFADALDALPFEAFATSGPSSFDLPPSAESPEPHAAPHAAAIVDEAAQYNPFPTRDGVVEEEGFEPPAVDAAAPDAGPPPPIEDISLPSAAMLAPEVTEETGSADKDPISFAPPELSASPLPSTTGTRPPPAIEGEAIELTCERYFDWALERSAFDGALVVDRDGLLVAERGLHELSPALLCEALPLARGLVRLHDAPPLGLLRLERDNLHVVIVWALQGDEACLAGLSGLAPPRAVDELADVFRALFLEAS